MDKFDLYRRIQSNLSDVDWKVLMFGSPKEDCEPGSDFSESHLKRLQAGKKRLKAEQVDRRLVILDRSILGDDITAERLAAIVAECKTKCKATRALIVIDYLQLLPVPDEVANRGDLNADKFRVRLLQKVIEGSKTTTNPLGDAMLAISEARKPTTAKDPWGQSLSELMGTARVGYAPTAVLLYRPMDHKEMQHYYDLPLTKQHGEKYRKSLAEIGIAPLMLILEKGRDGMIRGEWAVEFHFRRTRFREIKPGEGTKAKLAHGISKHEHDIITANLASPEAIEAGKSAATQPALPPVGFGKTKLAKKSSKATDNPCKLASKSSSKTALKASSGSAPKASKKKQG
jgi:hypothetical protein